MARGHLDEEFHAELARDFEGVVPADRMGDAGREVLADGFGVRQGGRRGSSTQGIEGQPKRQAIAEGDPRTGWSRGNAR